MILGIWGGKHTALCKIKSYNEKALGQPTHTGLTTVPSKCNCGCH